MTTGRPLCHNSWCIYGWKHNFDLWNLGADPSSTWGTLCHINPQHSLQRKWFLRMQKHFPAGLKAFTTGCDCRNTKSDVLLSVQVHSSFVSPAQVGRKFLLTWWNWSFNNAGGTQGERLPLPSDSYLSTVLLSRPRGVCACVCVRARARLCLCFRKSRAEEGEAECVWSEVDVLEGVCVFMY